MRSFERRSCLSLLALVVVSSCSWLMGMDESDRTSFLRQNCADCHSGSDGQGGLNLDELNSDLSHSKTAAVWTRIHDRVANGEMPPKDADSIAAEARTAFVRSTRQWISETQKSQFAKSGRVGTRRLTNLQLERTLHDLLGIDIPLASEMPLEPRGAEFNTLADRQPMSHFHLEQHLKVVDLALDELIRRTFVEADDHWSKHFTAQEISRTRDKCREPEFINEQAVIWSSQLIFYGRLPATTALSDGWYRVRFQARAIKKPKDHGVWCSVRTGQCVSSAPLLGWAGSFEAAEEPREFSFDVWIPKGHMLEIRPHDRTLKQAKFAGGQASNGEAEPQGVAGIGIDWLSMERIHLGPTQQKIRDNCFDGLEFVNKEITDNGELSTTEKKPARLRSSQPKSDIRRLLTQFASRAFRRPVAEVEIEKYIEFALRNLEDSDDLVSALRTGLRAILCSPRFIYFDEKPGQLDDHAIATRLSYFLWNSMPDERLLELAATSKLKDKQVLASEVTRMLENERGKQFIADFTAQWLELNHIDFTEPDTKLYTDFDAVVQYSMLDETHQFLLHLLSNNAPVRSLLDSDHTFLNSRLARFYEIDHSQLSDQSQRYSLKPSDHRMGLLSHGSILKVTANGTNTSPVLRGVWIANRILGDSIPPPPENVPAIEPDVRGAKTIRDQLEKHRSDPSCTSCHSKMDPPGFALENFDASGKFRTNYLKLNNGKLTQGQAIDSSYTLANGQKFKDLQDFIRLITSQPERLAKNLAEKLLTYGTGAPLQFADRESISEIVAQSAKDDYGIRTLVQAVVTSPSFLMK
jgi:Protein of unknown function (DUF1592)/Protein of unknown function (DUF1588)/Protein of unknown function (DUF1585)/Protein of unknown function (DUF1595)/Protein of unknown function (DUF1587)/Planctomycete cytochrome C